MQHPKSDIPFSCSLARWDQGQVVCSFGNAVSSTDFFSAGADFYTLFQLLKIIAVFFVFVVCHHFGRSLGQTVQIR